MRDLRILIAGGGIGGLAVPVALRQAGTDVDAASVERLGPSSARTGEPTL